MIQFKRLFPFVLFWAVILVPGLLCAQEVFFFTEGTDVTFYDQGLVDVNGLGESVFEYTYPPGSPQYNDKVPCSTTAYEGATSLKFNYTSAENGNWRATIYRKGWTVTDISNLDSISFYVFSEVALPGTALPLIGLRASNTAGNKDVDSNIYPLADYNGSIEAGKWTRITFPLHIFFDDTENDQLDYTVVKGIIFNQSENNGSSRLILVDEIAAFKGLDEILPVENLTATGYDSHVELNWTRPVDGLSYRVYASFDGGQTFGLRAETTKNYYLDFIPETARNSVVTYQVATQFQGTESEPVEIVAAVRDFSDDELLDMMQQYTFRYFWEGAHQATGMALERSNGNGRTAASGATGMGLMAMIVAHEREYRPQQEIKDRILMILEFLENCERHHGAWSHWYNADTYKTQPFTPDDDGGDIVETSFVAAGLIALKNYFLATDEKSVQIRETADRLWKEIDWEWYRNGGQNVLYWHWSPNVGFQKNMKVTGWNECQVTYIMAASSPTHGIPKEVYDEGWARSGNMVNTRTFYGYNISLSSDWGGPLFWIHYSHLGINPNGLKDQYANYWQEHVNTARIHHAYSISNPLGFENYSDKNWGLTASDDPDGYTAHQPMSNDNGTISPTAALASMPFTPEESMKALKYFYRERGRDLYGIYGPYDAFNDERSWVQESYIGIDQGPIVVMIENYRTGLLWNTVMQDADVQTGLNKLGFQYNTSTGSEEIFSHNSLKVYPNPGRDRVSISLPERNLNQPVLLKVFTPQGIMVTAKEISATGTEFSFDCSALSTGFYLLYLQNGENWFQSKLMVQKQKK
jgi:hypothetical protein